MIARSEPLLAFDTSALKQRAGGGSHVEFPM
jgi:hypothetical protein